MVILQNLVESMQPKLPLNPEGGERPVDLEGQRDGIQE